MTELESGNCDVEAGLKNVKFRGRSPGGWGINAQTSDGPADPIGPLIGLRPTPGHGSQ